MTAGGHLIIFGFEPFGGAQTNPSGRAARALDRTQVAGVPVVGVVLPVVWRSAWPGLAAVLAGGTARAVLGVGQGGATFRVERCALNHAGAREDNTGMPGPHGPVVATAPPRLAVRLDVGAVVAAVRRQVGAEALVEPSENAGDYLCNHTLFHLLNGTAQPAGFLHVPRPEHAAQDAVTAAVRAAAAALIPGAASAE